MSILLALFGLATEAVTLPCELPTQTSSGPPLSSPRQYFSVVTAGNAQISATQVGGSLYIGGVMQSHPEVNGTRAS